MKKSVKRTVIALFLAGAIVSSLGATSVGALTIDNASMVDSAYDKPVVVKENKEITDADTLYYRAVNNINDVPVESIPLQDSDLKVTCDNGDIYTFKSYVTTQVLKETRTRSGEGEQLIAVTRVASTEQEPTSALIKSQASRSSSSQTANENYTDLTMTSTLYFSIKDFGNNRGVNLSRVSGTFDLKNNSLTGGGYTNLNLSSVTYRFMGPQIDTIGLGIGEQSRIVSGNTFSFNTGAKGYIDLVTANTEVSCTTSTIAERRVNGILMASQSYSLENRLYAL